jgi:TatD DNase family protein
MIDSHAHLDDPVYDPDRNDVIRRAFDSGLEAIVTIGCDLKTSRAAVELADRNDRIFAAVGMHPHEASDADDATLEELLRLARHRKVVAWGETGLDYHYMHSPREAQVVAFRSQIRLAREANLPLVVHMREADDDAFRLLEAERSDSLRGVFHCFTAGADACRRALELGFMISLSGIVTFPKAADLQAVAGSVPLDRLMIETDCPYLTPVPHRGTRNEPSFVRNVAAKIAELKTPLTLEAVSAATAANTRRLFGIANLTG